MIFFFFIHSLRIRPMILFLSDWKHYPNAVVHTQTRNKSFLEIADKYRQMGIKNYYFMLALHNPKLVDVDPFDPNLTTDQKIDIDFECMVNPWYFFREVARVPAMAGSVTPAVYLANRGNIALYWLFFNHITSILIQPRQTGKTVGGDMLSVYIMDVGGNNTQMFLLTKGTDLQTEAIARIKGMRELLPKYLYSKDKKDSDNKTGLNNARLNNTYRTGVARSSQQAANNLGRGLVVPIVHVDEPPFITWIATTLAALRAAGTAAREIAERNKAMWGVFLTTTPARRDTRDGRHIYQMVNNAWQWSEVIFDCRDRADAWRMVDAGSRDNVNAVNVTLTHTQLGKSDSWLFESIRQSGGTREEAERDFLLIWNSGSQRSPLALELNQAIHRSKCEPSMVDVSPQNYVMRWYVTPPELEMIKKNSKLIMGLDSSDAIGKDAIAMVLIDVSTLAVVATSTVKFASLFEFTKWLATFLRDHPEVLLIPERKSSAPMIIDTLLTLLPAVGIDPFKMIYNTIVDEALNSQKGKDEFEELKTSMAHRNDMFYIERKKSFGFVTDGAKRALLYGNILQTAARESCNYIYDSVLITEILGLAEKNGRIDHSEMGHDDHVISWLLTHWLLNVGSNLRYYGIMPEMVKSALRAHAVESTTITEKQQAARQNEYMVEIDKLVAEIAEVENPAMLQLYENRLRYLAKKVELTGGDPTYTYDTIVGKVRQEREKRKIISGYTGENNEGATVKTLNDTIDLLKQSYYRQSGGNVFYHF